MVGSSQGITPYEDVRASQSRHGRSPFSSRAPCPTTGNSFNGRPAVAPEGQSGGGCLGQVAVSPIGLVGRGTKARAEMV